MRKELINAINNAIENNTEISVTFDSHRGNAISWYFIPDAMDLGQDTCIMYFGTNIITVNLDDVEYDETICEYICDDGAAVLTISFE